MGAICQYLINSNVINQGAKGWSCCGEARCQPRSSYSSFSPQSSQDLEQSASRSSAAAVWRISDAVHRPCVPQHSEGDAQEHLSSPRSQDLWLPSITFSSTLALFSALV